MIRASSRQIQQIENGKFAHQSDVEQYSARMTGADKIFVTPRLMQMMRELVEKYPDGYEGFHDEMHLSGDVLAASRGNGHTDVSAAPDVAPG